MALADIGKQLSDLFKECREKKGVSERDIYPLLVDYLQNEFGDRMVVEQNRPLLLQITAFLEDMKPYLGYSGSDADVVLYHKQEAIGFGNDSEILRRSGQYAFRKQSIIYPSVIIQVITNTQTGKLQDGEPSSHAHCLCSLQGPIEISVTPGLKEKQHFST